ncbi:MAG: 3-methyl-2-oxobutanoate hydroxymethyltransferase [Bacteroidales bacterium]|nr:3-methyl-2-oxobutanoate hydroxymethyltransferase [Bacteroidales bacterium]
MTEGVVKKVTVQTLQKMKSEGVKISMLTAYDYTMATILDAAGVDSILVGDSAANVVDGWSTTLPISVKEMTYHAAAVVRATKRAFVVVDMPFGSYQASVEDAVRNAVELMKGSGADAVKIEGGEPYIPHIKAILTAGIPVVGHIGLTPQSVHKFGGYGLRASEKAEADQLKKDARLLSEVGCTMIVIEKVPATLAMEISRSLPTPIIGIGAGANVDGQVLVGQDMLGMSTMFKPKFVRKYLNLFDEIKDAVSRYDSDVKNGSFPSAEESY